MNIQIIGLSYGDEGKARVAAWYQEKYNLDWSARFNGSNNAGHTVYDNNKKQYKLHCVPVGAVFNKKCAIDTGVVLNLQKLKEELGTFDHKVDLYISENVHIVSPAHLEADKDGSGLGTTKSGVMYAYADRALRRGVRITQELLDEAGIKATIYRGLIPAKNNEGILFEGAQGLLLDQDYGDYPYVTSSTVVPSGFYRSGTRVGVMKAYTTRVGDGPPYYPDLENVRNLGGEFGTTTGRPRRCTWNDVDQIQYTIDVAQPDEIVVTKLDVLKDVEISVYKNGEEYTIGSLDSYKDFLFSTFKQIKWYSEAPYGELIEV